MSDGTGDGGLVSTAQALPEIGDMAPPWYQRPEERGKQLLPAGEVAFTCETFKLTDFGHAMLRATAFAEQGRCIHRKASPIAEDGGRLGIRAPRRHASTTRPRGVSGRTGTPSPPPVFWSASAPRPGTSRSASKARGSP